MNKMVKLSMIGIGIVTALFVAALIVFAFTFDLNDYKDRITKSVQDETGRTLRFDGDLKLTILPHLGVKLGGMSLGNAEGFGEKPMVQVVSAQVNVRLLPLFKGEVSFGQMELDGLSLNLIRNGEGVTNWADIVDREPNSENVDLPKKRGNNFSLEVAGITIKNANLIWDDQVAGTKIFLQHINFVTGQLVKDIPFPVTGNLDFECSTPNAKGALSFSGKSSVDLPTRQYSFMDMKLSVAADGEDVPGGKGSAELGFESLDLDFINGHAKIDGLTLSSYGITARLDGSFEGITKKLTKIAATLSVDPFDMRKTLLALGKKPLITADPAAFAKVGGKGDFVFIPGQIKVKNFQVDIDDVNIMGKGHIKRGEDYPFYLVRMNVGELDLDRYLPPEHGGNATTSKGTTPAQGDGDKILSSEIIRQLYLDVEIGVDKLKFDGMRSQNVKVKIKSRYGLLRISPVSADSYGGTISAGATINAMSKYPKTDVILGVKNVDVGALSTDLLGKASYAGIADFNAAVSCDGERVPTMLRSMNGKVSFSLADGVFPGVDLVRMGKETHQSKGDKDGTIKASKTDSTKFGSISGTGVITGGILRNKDLEVKAPGLRAAGQGSVVLPTKQIDYLLKAKLTPTAKGQGGESADDLYGIMVPIRVGGTLDNPHYWVSIPEYIKAIGGAVLGTAGAVIGGVTGVIKGVGKAIVGGGDKSKKDDSKKRKRFLGIF